MQIEQPRNVSELKPLKVGRVEPLGDCPAVYRVVDAAGDEVSAVSEFLRELTASDCSPLTLRSYAYDLLGWFRFLWTVDIAWERASRVDARDYALWLGLAQKRARRRRDETPLPGSLNSVTGKPYPSRSYAAATRRHARAVIHAFYDYHVAAHGRPLINPFPDARAGGRSVSGHRSPMLPRTARRAAPYQPKLPARIPRAIPDERFNELFAALASHRDRALLAFWISTGARARELLDTVQGRVEPADQLIGVVRKGSRALQMLPASADAFVWLRLYHHGLGEAMPRGADVPVWWTLRRPVRPLSYDAVRMMFTRAQRSLGSNWTLHDLRHYADGRVMRPAGPGWLAAQGFAASLSA